MKSFPQGFGKRPQRGGSDERGYARLGRGQCQKPGCSFSLLSLPLFSFGLWLWIDPLVWSIIIYHAYVVSYNVFDEALSNWCNATVLRCIQYHDKVGEKVSLCGWSWSFPRLFMSLLLFFFTKRGPLCCGTLQLEQRGSMLPHRLQLLGKIELYHCRSLVLQSAYHHSPRFAIFCSFSRSPTCCLLTCPAYTIY